MKKRLGWGWWGGWPHKGRGLGVGRGGVEWIRGGIRGVNGEGKKNKGWGREGWGAARGGDIARRLGTVQKEDCIYVPETKTYRSTRNDETTKVKSGKNELKHLPETKKYRSTYQERWTIKVRARDDDTNNLCCYLYEFRQPACPWVTSAGGATVQISRISSVVACLSFVVKILHG